MRLLYLDCFAGISGDMFLGALLDLGVSQKTVERELRKLGLCGWRLHVARARDRNVSGLRVEVRVGSVAARNSKHCHGERTVEEIKSLIKAAALSPFVKEHAVSMFHRIALAESKIHRIKPSNVHFHEVGAIDSIVDIVGGCVALEQLGVEVMAASVLRLGGGFVDCAHGRLPVPAPATLELLKGIPVQQGDEPFELVTPTGAALVTEFCRLFGPMPLLRVQQIGYGLGQHQLNRVPNALRAILGETAANSKTAADAEADTVSVIETNIDNMNPELLGAAMDELLSLGALDVFFSPVQMKKNRPGVKLTVLCANADRERFARWLLRHTSTFGVRMHEEQRLKLVRETHALKTRYGKILVKIGRLDGKVVSVSPEFESCKLAAQARKIPLKTVYNETIRRAESLYD